MLLAHKEMDLEVNWEKTQVCALISSDVRQEHNINIGNECFEYVAEFEYLAVI